MSSYCQPKCEEISVYFSFIFFSHSFLDASQRGWRKMSSRHASDALALFLAFGRMFHSPYNWYYAEVNQVVFMHLYMKVNKNRTPLIIHSPIYFHDVWSLIACCIRYILLKFSDVTRINGLVFFGSVKSNFVIARNWYWTCWGNIIIVTHPLACHSRLFRTTNNKS